MEYNHICMGCMMEKGNIEACPHCGWIENTTPDEQYYLPPRTILNDRYLIGRVLGHGGFGITYLGYDTKLNLKLAIKEYLPIELASRTLNDTTVSVYSSEKKSYFEYGLNKFLDEAKTLAKFNQHPCIVSVYDYFNENNTGYLVMEYFEGIALDKYLKSKGGKIPYEDALKIMMPVIDALREVHNYGILHRDVSPDNIYITSKKQVKLLDFGAARQAMGEKSKSLSVILKPGYAPPEQYYTKGKQGPWTDIYATAATIYRMITGITTPEAMERMMEDNIKSPSSLGVNIPKSLENVLIKALSIKMEDRYENIKDFQDELSNKNFPIGNIEKREEDIRNNSNIPPETIKDTEKENNEEKLEKVFSKDSIDERKKRTIKYDKNLMKFGEIALIITISIAALFFFDKYYSSNTKTNNNQGNNEPSIQSSNDNNPTPSSQGIKIEENSHYDNPQTTKENTKNNDENNSSEDDASEDNSNKSRTYTKTYKETNSKETNKDSGVKKEDESQKKPEENSDEPSVVTTPSDDGITVPSGEGISLPWEDAEDENIYVPSGEGIYVPSGEGIGIGD